MWDNSVIYDFLEDKEVYVDSVREFNSKWLTNGEGGIDALLSGAQKTISGRFCLLENKDLPELKKYKEIIKIYYKDVNYITTMSNVDVLVNGSGDLNKVIRGERTHVNGYFINEDLRNKYYKISPEDAKNIKFVNFGDNDKKQLIEERNKQMKETQTIYHISGTEKTLHISELTEFEKENNLPDDSIKRLFRGTRKTAYNWYISKESRDAQVLDNTLLENSTYVKEGDMFKCLECNTAIKCRFAHLKKKNFKCNVCNSKAKLSPLKRLCTELKEHVEVTQSYKIDNYTIGIFIPSINFGVKINNSVNTSREIYNVSKANNIFVLQLHKLDLENKYNIIKSMIINKLKITPNKIYARKCKIVNVSPSEATKFYSNNHLQGSVGASMHIGLEYNNKLVSIMSFSKKVTKTKNETDLVRFASKVYTNIPGGFSKLLNYAVNILELKSITTFSDNMYSDGSVYKCNEFKLDYEIPPDYKYLNDTKTQLFHKSNFMKSKIRANPNLVFKEELTEKELMELNGYSRYYDAGKIKWRLKC